MAGVDTSLTWRSSHWARQVHRVVPAAACCNSATGRVTAVPHLHLAPASGARQAPCPTVQLQLTHSLPWLAPATRRRLRCNSNPFGRDIFEEAPAQPHGDDAAAHGPDVPTPAQLTPHALFVALFMDRIYKDPGNPAFQQLSTQRSGKLSLACAMWHCLVPAQKVLFYQAFMPLCTELNTQQAARGSQPVRGLLQRVYAHMTALPAPQRDGVNEVLQAAMQQRLQLLQAAVEASQTAGYTASPAHRAPGDGATVAAGATSSENRTRQGSPSSSSSMRDWAVVIHADEGNRRALRLALEAAGFGHMGWQLDDLEAGEAISVTTHSEVRVRKQAAGAVAPTTPSDVRLVTRLQAPPKQEFWTDFVSKCRLAWDVFFPQQQLLSPARAMRARLQMILVSDRSGLDLPTLMKIRDQSLAALAQSNGWDNLSELELQVASTKANGEQVKLALPLSSMPAHFMLRNADEYDYEYYDDDDYDIEQDETKVGEIVEGAARISAAAAQQMAVLGPGTEQAPGA